MDDWVSAEELSLALRYDTSPLGKGNNWVTGVGGLPAFIRAVAHALIRNGHSESNAIQIAVGVVKNWASGQGNVSAKTRAKAAAALAEWEAKKAASHGKTAAKKRNLGEEGMADIERRDTPGLVELRTAPDSSKIGGYASVFGKLSRNLGGFVERVEPGAFNASRAAGWPNVVARYNHDPSVLLGTTAGRTLDLRIDPDQGLWYEVTPPKARADILELVQRGDVQHSSFAFKVTADDWTTTDQGFPMRSLNEVVLVDVAPVVTPAYPDATVGLRSLAARFDADLEEVRSLAKDNELIKFFKRTDGSSVTVKPRMTGAQAKIRLMGRREDPWAS